MDQLSVAFSEFVMVGLQIMAALFIFAIGLLILWVIVSYVLYVTQTQ